jgi:hypothetical protein
MRIAMADPENSDENIAEYITRRKVARITLKKIRGIVSVWEEEEKQRVSLLKGFTLIMLWVLVILLVAIPLYWVSFHSHPRIQAFAGSISLGIFGAIALILWSYRDGKK